MTENQDMRTILLISETVGGFFTNLSVISDNNHCDITLNDDI